MTEEKEKKERKPKTVPVRIVEGKGKSSLVQWSLKGGDLRRAYVPVDKVTGVDEGARCDKDALEAGIPYGVPWKELIKVDVDPAAVAQELRRRGVWTSRDLEMNPKVLRRIVDKMTGLTPGNLRRAAAQYEKGVEK